jgi:hypothetical protein
MRGRRRRWGEKGGGEEVELGEIEKGEKREEKEKKKRVRPRVDIKRATQTQKRRRGKERRDTSRGEGARRTSATMLAYTGT